MSRQIAAPVTAKDAQCRWARRMCRSLRHASQTSGALRTHILLVSLLMLGAPLYAASSGNTITPTGVITTLTTPAAHAACGGVPVPPGLQPPPPTPPGSSGPPSSAPPTSAPTAHECPKADRIDYSYLEAKESGGQPPTTIGYVPGHGRGVGKHSGVTVGYGVDLGKRSVSELQSWGIDQKLIDKLKPYFGKTGSAAELYLNGDKTHPAHHLTLTDSEVAELDNGARVAIIGALRDDFNSDNVGHVDFDQLPAGTQTALADFFYQHGQYSDEKYKKLWSAVSNLDWAKVAKLLPLEPGDPRSRLQDDGKLVAADVKDGKFDKKGIPVCG